MSGTTIAVVLILIVGAFIYVNWREQKTRREAESLLKLRLAKREEMALKKELTKATEEINLAEIDYKRRMDEYRKKYHGSGDPDRPE